YIVDECNMKSIADKFGDETDEDKIAFQELKRQAIEGLKARGLATNQEYIDRLKHELLVIKHLKFAKYFLTYSKIMEIVSEYMLFGNARGCFVPGSRVKMADGMFAEIENIVVGDKVIDAFGKEQTVETTFEYDVNEE